MEVQWDISIEDDIRRRDQFFFENGLNIHPDDVRCRWSIRHSNSTMNVRQCISGSYRKQVVGSTSRVPTARYSYVRCLAFITVFLRNNEVYGAAGYLRHSEACEASKPIRDPVYRLLPHIRKGVENLLSLNVSTADILVQNVQIVKILYGKRTLIDNTVRSSQFRMWATSRMKCFGKIGISMFVVECLRCSQTRD